jgi:deoxyribose-phosphate aldolase
MIPGTAGRSQSDLVRRLRQVIDHTLLTPEATPEQVEDHINEALELGIGAVCLNPAMLPQDSRGLRIVTVCGFPFGAHETSIKAFEAELALDRGADDIDMVANLGAVKAHDWEQVRRDLDVVRLVVPAEKTLKLIIESAVLTVDEIVACCKIGEEAGVDYIKTSTGFHRAGGANVADVRLMSGVLGEGVGIKASGGIHTIQQALALLGAGATRLGVSGSRRLLASAANL